MIHGKNIGKIQVKAKCMKYWDFRESKVIFFLVSCSDYVYFIGESEGKLKIEEQKTRGIFPLEMAFIPPRKIGLFWHFFPAFLSFFLIDKTETLFPFLALTRVHRRFVLLILFCFSGLHEFFGNKLITADLAN